MMNTEKKTCEDIQKLMKALVGYLPDLVFQEPIKSADYEIVDGLTKAYGERGFRRYLENSINIAKNNAAMVPGNLYQAMFARGRIEAFIEIYAASREAFANTLKEDRKNKTLYEKEQSKNEGRQESSKESFEGQELAEEERKV